VRQDGPVDIALVVRDIDADHAVPQPRRLDMGMGERAASTPAPAASAPSPSRMARRRSTVRLWDMLMTP